MTKSSWIRNLTSRPAGARRKPSPRPLVEPLEDRCVPATITVNSILDTAAPPAGTVTLRSAITQAEADPTPDTINFAPALLGQTITLTANLPILTKGETITGLGQNSLTINGANAFHPFTIAAGSAATITDLTITQGLSGGAGTNGGAILNNGSNLVLQRLTLTQNNAANTGGGIENSTTGNATISDCTFANNQSNGAAAGGGAISNEGSMVLNTSTLAGNFAVFGGAGIDNFNGGTIAVNRCTISGNIATGVGAGFRNNSASGAAALLTNTTIAYNTATGSTGGGGVSTGAGVITILNCTIVANSDTTNNASGAGGISIIVGTVNLTNSIVAQNHGAPATSDNTFTAGGATLNQTTNIVTALQVVGPLQNNGGTTLSMAPLPNLPAAINPINTGTNAAASTLTTDQRGFLRVVGATVDIGAVEFQPPQTVTTLAVAPASPTAANVSVTLTATVTLPAASTAPNNPVTGKVTFLNGTTVLGTGTLDATGKATLVTNTTTGSVTVPPLPVGTDALTARYEGDFNFGPSLSTVTNQVVQNRKITAGTYDPTTGSWSLRNTNTAGAPDTTLLYGAPGSGIFPVVGDWTGTGVFTVGIFVQATATFQIRFSNTPGAPTVTFAFGPAGVGLPVAGDWTGSGKWGVGVFDPTKGNWNLRNELSGGLPDAGSFLYGAPGSKPVVGDWDADGKFTIGVVEPDGTWKLKNNNTTGTPDFIFQYGSVTDTPIAGDWDANGTWTPGVVTPTGGAPLWQLRNSNSAGAPDITPFAYGTATAIPTPGSWVFPGLPLQAAGGDGPGAAALDPKALPVIISAALDRLQSAGVDAATLALLSKVTVETRPLDSGDLGEALPSLNLVYIDETAAGHGWFVDPTPGQDEEFQAGQALPKSGAAGRMDLLTVLLHEYGHIAGLGESASGLMAPTLAAGTRATDALDAVFGQK